MHFPMINIVFISTNILSYRPIKGEIKWTNIVFPYKGELSSFYCFLSDTKLITSLPRLISDFYVP